MKKIENEPILEYKKGSKERIDLEKELKEMTKKAHQVPLRIGDKKIFNGQEQKQVMVRIFYFFLPSQDKKMRNFFGNSLISS